VYVDYDPVVLAHARALLTSNEVGATEYIDADLRDTGTILSQAASILDFSRPVAVTLLAILHAIPDADDPYAIVSRLMAAVPAGSYLVISHIAADLLEPDTVQGVKETWKGNLQQQITWRSREQVARFFEGTDLAEPGLVRPEEWRADTVPGDARRSAGWAGMGRKR